MIDHWFWLFRDIVGLIISWSDFVCIHFTGRWELLREMLVNLRIGEGRCVRKLKVGRLLKWKKRVNNMVKLWKYTYYKLPLMLQTSAHSCVCLDMDLCMGDMHLYRCTAGFSWHSSSTQCFQQVGKQYNVRCAGIQTRKTETAMRSV